MNPSLKSGEDFFDDVAFDVSKEPPNIRELYGEHVHGRQTLIARRLLERGVRFVQLFSGGTFGSPRRNWDGHEDMKQNHGQEEANTITEGHRDGVAGWVGIRPASLEAADEANKRSKLADEEEPQGATPPRTAVERPPPARASNLRPLYGRGELSSKYACRSSTARSLRIMSIRAEATRGLYRS